MIAATDTGLVPMRVSKAVGLKDGDDLAEFMVLDEPGGDRHLVIQVDQTEGFSLAAPCASTGRSPTSSPAPL